MPLSIFKTLSKTSLSVLISTGLLVSTNSVASAETIIENPAVEGSVLKDSWVVKYEADDFSEKIRKATVLYIPENFGEQAAFFLRCKNAFANFSMQYTELQQNLMDDGQLPNASKKFAKHGYLYDDKQKLTVKSNSDSESYRLSIGGQNHHLTKLFKSDKTLQPGQLGMSWFYSFTFEEMPSFRSDSTTDEASDFFTQINQAIAKQETVSFNLETSQGHKRTFNLDTKRMQQAVPKEVMEFCLTKRKLQ